MVAGLFLFPLRLIRNSSILVREHLQYVSCLIPHAVLLNRIAQNISFQQYETKLATKDISVERKELNKDLLETTTGAVTKTVNTDFQDSTAGTEVTNPQVEIPAKHLDPYNGLTPIQIMTKSFKVLEIQVDETWTGSVINFPDALFTQNAIQHIMSMFKYFRADVHVFFRLTSTVYHQGSLQIAYRPCNNGASPDIFRDSSQSAVFCQYATPGTVSMTLPWLHPQPFGYLTNLTTMASMIGSIILSPITPYRTAATVQPFTLSAFARFVKPQLAGPLQVPAPAMKTQSSDPIASGSVNQQAEKLRPRPVSMEAVSKSIDMVHHSNILTPLLDPVVNVVEAVSGIARDLAVGSFLDKPTAIKATVPVQPRWGTDTALTKGLDTCARLSGNPSSSLATGGVLAGDTSHMTVWKLAQVPMLHTIGSLSMASDPTKIFFLVAHPNYPPNDGTENQPDYLRAVSHAHRYWRGSIKYHVQFVSNGFAKGRVRVFISFNGPITSPLLENGDLFTRIIEINGPTQFDFCVPYLYTKYWQQTEEISDDAPYVYFVLEDSTVSTGEEQIIDVVVYRAAGSDIQLSSLVNATFNATTTATPVAAPLMKTQTHVRAQFSQHFDSLVTGSTISVERGFCTDETSQSVSDLMKRYAFPIEIEQAGPFGSFTTLYPSRAFTLLNGRAQDIGDTNGLAAPFNYFMNFFLFWRGDIRLKFRNLSTTTHPYFQVSMGTEAGTFSPSNGVVYTYSALNPDLAVEVPYSATLPYFFIQGPVQDSTIVETDLVPPAAAGALGEVEVLMSAGDNFVCGHLMPPPNYFLAPPSPSKETITTRTAKVVNKSL